MARDDLAHQVIVMMWAAGDRTCVLYVYRVLDADGQSRMSNDVTGDMNRGVNYVSVIHVLALRVPAA